MNYAPLAPNEPQNSPILWNYEIMKRDAGQLRGYVKVVMDVRAAFNLADASPLPHGVRLGIMKQVSNTKEITLAQMRMLLGWAADKAQRRR